MIQLNGHDATAAELGNLALYSYGHFTSMRVENSAVRGLSMHLDRLANDCATLFDTRLDIDLLRDLMRRFADKFTGPEIMRVTVYDPQLELGHPGNDSSPQVLISNRPAASVAPPPLRLMTTEYSRDLPAVKHVGLFETIRTRRVAQRQGFDDVLFVGSDSRISEGATWNVGFYDGRQVIWPKADVLSGVTMRLIESVLRQQGIQSATLPMEAEALSGMQAAFATNVAVGLRPIRAINGHEYAVDLPIIAAIARGYSALPAESL